MQVDLPPKGQHYIFAHFALPLIALGNPRKTYKDLNGGGASAYLTGLWAGVGREVGESLPHGGLPVRKERLSERLEAFLIELPPPSVTPEAFFVAVVFTVRKRMLSTEALSSRYFTLELGRSQFSGLPEYFFCEWLEWFGGTNPAHANHGTLPDEHLSTFLEAIRRVV